MAITKPTAAAFKTHFNEFNAKSDSDVEAAINIAHEISSVSDMALLYLSAHILALDAERTAKIDGGSGEVTEDTLGPKTAKYKTMAKDERDVFFTRTSYGRMFLILEKRSARYVMSPTVIG